jgi:hypothetical protein
VFARDEAAGAIAPDTLTLMTEALALLDHVPGDDWMAEWTRTAAGQIGCMGPEVGAAGGFGARGPCWCSAAGQGLKP